MCDLLIKAKVMIMVKHIQCTSVDSREMPNDPLSVCHCLTLLSPASGMTIAWELLYSVKSHPPIYFICLSSGEGEPNLSQNNLSTMNGHLRTTTFLSDISVYSRQWFLSRSVLLCKPNTFCQVTPAFLQVSLVKYNLICDQWLSNAVVDLQMGVKIDLSDGWEITF